MVNYRWNNFDMWFPGQQYREFVKGGNRTAQIVRALDKVLDEQSFNGGRFRSLIRKKGEYFNSYKPIYKRAYQEGNRELTPDEESEVSKLGELEAVNYQELDTLLEPVIGRMIELGYPLEELVR